MRGQFSSPLPTLVEVLGRRARQDPQRVAYTFLGPDGHEERQWTYAELKLKVYSLARELEERDLGGERVVLLYPPGLEFVTAFLACLSAGVVAVPALPPRRRSVERLKAIIADCAPAAILSTKTLRRRTEKQAGRSAFEDLLWLATDVVSGVDGATWEPPQLGSPSLAFLQYTSGSTSTPKGVMVSHGNLANNLEETAQAFRTSADSVIVSWLPVYHDMGLIGGVLQPLWAGAPCVLLSPAAFLQRPVRWLQAISHYRATISGGPDFAYDLCVRRVPAAERAKLDLTSWQVAFNGAEPVRHGTLEQFAEAFAPQGFKRSAFLPCYGLAEATLFVTGAAPAVEPRILDVLPEALERNIVVPGGRGDRRLVGCGRVGSSPEVRIVDSERRVELSAGQVGEIWIAGPSVAGGYWGNPEASAETFEAHIAGASGIGPFLRTGDLGFLVDGELFVSGRLKDLIILRGRNLYPQDLEATAAAAHPGLRLAGGIAFSVEVDGEERLVVVHEVGRRATALVDITNALLRAVAEEHEVAIHEVVLIRQGSLPKTSSGKPQRRACRQMYLEGELRVVASHSPSVAWAAPQEIPTASQVAPAAFDRAACLALAPSERAAALRPYLRQRLARAAGCPPAEVPEDEPLIRILLDSLRLVELVHHLAADLGAILNLDGLFEGTTLAELAEEIAWTLEEGVVEPGFKAEASVVEGQGRALSSGQSALWFVEELAPTSGVHHLVAAARVEKGFEPEVLRRALQLLAARHGALRTTFELDAGEPVRRVHRRLDPDFEVVRESASTERLESAARQPFDLRRGPLLRVRCFETEEGAVVLWVVHHLIVDFWSLKILAEELTVLYRGGAEGEEAGHLAAAHLGALEATYEDHVAEQERLLGSARGNMLRDFWLAELAAAPRVLELSTDRPRPQRRSFRGSAVTCTLDASLHGALEALARTSNATLFTTLLATFQVLLARLTGQSDVLVGVPAANRRSAEKASVVGYFVNPVVVRGTLAGVSDFTRFLAQVRRRVLGALAHQEYPFPEVARHLEPERVAGRSPIFQALFVLQRGGPDNLGALALGVPGARVELGTLELESVAVEPNAAAFDLSLHVAELPGGLHASLNFDRELFDRTTARRLLRQWQTLLTAVVVDSSQGLSDLAVLGPAERHQLVVEWQAGDGGERNGEPCLHQLFEAVAARAPERRAVVAGTRELSYGELNRRANHLARTLVGQGVGPEGRVGVLFDRTPELFVALLAVLKAGAAYVPLDPAYPTERLGLMMADSGAGLVLTDRGQAIPAGLPENLTVLEVSARDSPVAEVENLPVAVGPDHLAYLIYTSGSTGRPKGVAIPHRPAVRLLRWAGEVFPELGEEVLASTSVCFDLSIFEIFGPWSRGGTVVLARNALELPSLPGDRQVALVNTVPSAMGALLTAEALPTSVATVCLAGEALERRLVERLYSSGTVRRVFNLYGPSECTTYATWCLVPAGHPEAPAIGRPVAGSTAHVLSPSGKAVPLGVVGELFLGGVGVARGYFGQPGLTAERFVPDGLGGSLGARIYRTGDLARLLPTGDLLFLGRRDHQVKIRGFRIEPGEVEQALLDDAGVHAAVVLPLGESLWGFVVPQVGASFSAEGLRVDLGAKLPEYMVPEALVLLDALPLTPNGKVDRRALEELAGRRHPVQVDGTARSPRSPVEEALVEIWRDVLGVAQVGIEQNFFELGGHSLLGVRMISRVRATLGLDLPLLTLFEAPTILRLARRLEGGRTGEDKGPEPLPRDRPLALSFAQERLWFLDQLAVERAVYNMPAVVRWGGVLERAVLAAVLAQLVARHEALRTVFVEEDRGALRQKILPVEEGLAGTVLPRVDLRALPVTRRRDLAVELALSAGRRPFDLEARPSCRFLLLILDEEEYLLLINLHHVVADGASLGVLWRELAAGYSTALETAAGSTVVETTVVETTGVEPAALEAAVLQPADFAAWQRTWADGRQAAEQRSWWRERLNPLPAALDLPGDRPRPALQTFSGGLCAQRLSAEATRDLEALARQRSVTLFMAVLAGFEALLYRYSGQRDFAVGVPAAGRDQHQLEDLVGLFVNTLVLRAEDPHRGSFEDLLTRVRAGALDAFTHRDLPFEHLVETLGVERDASRNPLFQVMLAVQETLPAAGLPVRFERFDYGVARLDLTLFMERQPAGLELAFEYNTDLFDPTTAQRMLAGLCRLLHGAVCGLERPLVELSLLSRREERQLLSEWNELGTPATDLSLHRLFALAAEKTPERVALVWNDEQLSYGALRHRVGTLARALRNVGVDRETRVGVALERSPRLVAALLAVLEAGGAYVPLDPAYPAERLAFMVRDSGAALVIGTGDGRLFTAAAVRWVDFEDLSKGVGEPRGRAASAEGGGDLAYVIYTSGSTGRPKGVAIEHRSAATLVRWAGEVFTALEWSGALASTSVCFDLSIFELFAPLSHSGTVVLVENALALPELPGHRRVRLLNTVPSVADALLTLGGLPPAVTTVNLAGEPLSRSLVDRLRAGGAERVLNLYGPSECTTYSTWTEVPAGVAAAPTIGRPVAGSGAYVLDAHGRSVPTGVHGALFLGGAGVARGYLARPVLTAERFVPDPFAGVLGARLYDTGDRARWLPGGELAYLGRRDHQVKVRGFRIEPGEIEAALLAAPAVQAVAVVVTVADDTGPRLVAHGVADDDFDNAAMRYALAARLPAHMVPEVWIDHRELPQTPNGKVDRGKLARWELPTSSFGDGVAPAGGPVEVALMELFGELLGRGPVAADDDFFALGGHSLLATRLISRVRRLLAVELPVSALFEAPTPARLAQRIDRGASVAAVDSPLAMLEELRREAPAGSQACGPLSFAQERLWFLDQLVPGDVSYNMPSALRLVGALEVGALRATLEALETRHGALRTRFTVAEGRPLQRVDVVAVGTLPVVDLSALPEGREKARNLMAAAARQPFDLEGGALLRALLIRLAVDDHLVVLTLHHIVSDGWSMEVLVREVAALYSAFVVGEEPALEPLPLQVVDAARWQRRWLTGNTLERQLEYWRERLVGLPVTLELPTDRPRPAARRHRGGRWPLEISAARVAALETLGRGRGATLFMVLLAAFQMLLARLSGQREVRVGTPIANRRFAELEPLIGFFANTLVLRGTLRPGCAAEQLLEQARWTALGAYLHQDLPFELLVEELEPERDLSQAPLFQAMLVFQNAPLLPPELPGLAVEILPVHTHTSKFDLLLNLEAVADGGLVGYLEYDADLFDTTSVGRFAATFDVLLDGLVYGVEQPWNLLPLLSRSARHAVLREWNDTAMQETVPGPLEVITADEQLQVTSGIRDFFTRSSSRLWNQYGPSESHVVTEHALVETPRFWPSLPPIGRTIDDTRIMIADAWLCGVPVGVVGELVIAGACLARGYLDQPARTAECFVPDPFGEIPGGRVYRTGDRARWGATGEVEFLGRLDAQIKVRGFRVDLGEIESVLRGLPGVHQVAVVQEETTEAGGDRGLVAWLVPEATAGVGELEVAALRRALGKRLPKPMVPRLFAVLEGLPLTPSGKVDRRALARRVARDALGGSSGADYVAPRSPEEDVLAALWCELLRGERVGVRDNFFDLGGHSLLATRLIARIVTVFGVELALRQVFEKPTIEALAEAIVEARSGKPEKGLPPLAGARQTLPGGGVALSFAQERLWFLEQFTPGLSAYNLPFFARLRGHLQVATLEAALATILLRHEVLRATFDSRDDLPYQVFAPPGPCPLPLIDLSGLAVGGLAGGRAEDEALALARAEARRPFDIARGPLLRPRLVRILEGEHLLLLNQHHLVSDGWSREVLEKELVAAYSGEPLADLPVQYADYVAWQRRVLAEAGDALLDFWRQRLAGAPPRMELPTDRPRPAVQSYRGAVHGFRLSGATVEALEALGRGAGATLFMTLLAGFGGWLERLTGQRDLVVGTPVANRRRRELEDLIGLFVNTLVLRLDLAGDPALLALLPRVREMALSSYAHEELPFEHLVEALAPERSASYSPVFQVFFALQNVPSSRAEMPGLELEPVEVDAGGARFDLALAFWPLDDGGLGAAFETSRDLFDATTVARMASHLVTLLEGMARHPERPLGDLPQLSRAEAHQLLSAWNDTAMGGEDSTVDDLLHTAFRLQVARRPADVALVWGRERLTYGELGSRVEVLSQHLAARGVGPGEIVGLAMGRSPELVVALLAVLVAGGAYLPLDPTYPSERLVFMVIDARARMLLVDGEVPEALLALPVPILALDQEPHGPEESVLRSQAHPDDLAYVIYTSGSTGRPKGVMVTHRNAVNFAVGMDRRIGTGPGTWLALTSMSFDISVLELLWTLGRGFQVVLDDGRAGAALPTSLGNSTVPPAAPTRGMDFSLFYFASESGEGFRAGGCYRLLLEGARFADQHGFTAVWTPERHFHAFGGLYPNPSVTGAAVAAITENLAIRAGSVVLPLHDPVRVAEEWAVVDNLSNGRVAISFATGWHADDFIFAPDNFQDRKAVMEREIQTVRALWRGESVTRVGGKGQEVEVSIFPQPVQGELPFWLTAAGNPETFRAAGQVGANLLTHLLGQSVEELGEKITVYREAWRVAGHGGEGVVTVMLHTFVGQDLETVREQVRGPFCQYLKSASFLIANLARSMGWDDDLGNLSEEDMDVLLGHAFERYFETSGLLGTPETCLVMVERLKAIGIDEVGCLIDFGIDEELVLNSLKWLDEVRRRSQVPTAKSGGAMPASAPGEEIPVGPITHLQCTPSQAMVLAADSSYAEVWRDLEVLLLGGESLSPALLTQLRGKTSAVIHNMYGPTETTIWSTSERPVVGQGSVPIGRPIRATHIAVLDRRGARVPVGVAGELLIGGLGVTRGYLGRPALTAERFLPDASARQPGGRLYRTGDLARHRRDGSLEFLGRTDRQVKVLGHRIELGEIEALLGRQTGVREAAVAVHSGASGEPRLVAYLTRAEGSGPRLRVSEEERARLLAGQHQFALPNGMVVAHHDARQAQELYREVFDGAMYDRYGVTFKDGDCVFDVGANTGFFTLFVSQQCTPGSVYSFEPIPNNFEILRTNVALYGDNVQSFACGMAAESGKADFTFYPNIAGLSSRFADTGHDRRTVAMVAQSLKGDGALPALQGDELDAALDEYLRTETFECPLVTLSEVIREQGVERIDVLKIDVEGSEIEVLQGIEEEDWSKIGQFVLEVHSDELLTGTLALLEPRGFDIKVDDFLIFDGPEASGNGAAGGNGAAADTLRIYMLYAVRPGWRSASGATVPSATVPSGAARNGRKPLTPEVLRRLLAEHLPAYMVPASYVFLDHLPRTPNGKLDRRALRAPEASARAVGGTYVAPRTETERRVAEVWREVLKVDAIGVEDNFFEAGGTSLTLVQASRRLEGVFERPVPLVEMFRHPTVVTLAEYLHGSTGGAGAAEATVEKGQERARKQVAALEQPSPAVERQRAARARMRPRGRRGRRA